MFCANCGKDIGDATVCPYCSDTAAKAPETVAAPAQEPVFQAPVGQPAQQVYYTVPPVPPTPAPEKKRGANVFAILGFIFSFFFIFSPISLVFSILGTALAGKLYNGRNRGLAIAGIVLSALSLIVLFVIYAVVLEMNYLY